MFGRKKDTAASAEAPTDETTKPVGKNAPTPKRSVQQAQNQRPLVPTDRKLARAAERAQRLEAQNRMRLANETGDERFMAARDQGPQKRFARDFVDRRFMVGEYLMFAVFAFLIVSLSLSKFPQVTVYVTFALWILVGLVAIDSFIMTRMLKKALVARFGSVERGVMYYAVMRGMQFRKLRLPKPQVRRGEAPR
ncbi:hypothetical protein BLJ79_12375 [Arthrobacter sp. UCD-GKA]|uniref:DUF3043 domain-containing protein n=1 Tax=Arthrobacter sp. UCD-GKA TaxID=1913576 RepID=UPI0008DE29DF|nr:DUF3043 domain-containing protein [Arthrobacter sp. UCD-GKA]OIH84257.1 hypothetical protein BLJ79_12375 [Arthrobacter sp. UCD-GKA]